MNDKTKNAPAAFDLTKIKVVKQVTVPTLSAKDGQTLYVKFEGAIFLGKELKKTAKDGEPAKEKPADLASVVNLETGEQMHLIVAAVVKENLNETYPKEKYVGKSFAISKLGKRAGKRYFDYRVLEIEYGG